MGRAPLREDLNECMYANCFISAGGDAGGMPGGMPGGPGGFPGAGGPGATHDDGPTVEEVD